MPESSDKPTCSWGCGRLAAYMVKVHLDRALRVPVCFRCAHRLRMTHVSRIG